jgi:hypothetical protein
MAQEGVVYLIHLSRPYRHARHYLGWTQNLAHRVASPNTAPVEAARCSPRRSRTGSSSSSQQPGPVTAMTSGVGTG